jgi:redox-sensitive bicupin YhaK (pirin superfamily)
VAVERDDQSQQVSAGELALLEKETQASVRGVDDASGFLFFGAVPHNEPIVRGGPFVMNSEEQIRQAFLDYRSGRLF